jgi:hypothetical protein
MSSTHPAEINYVGDDWAIARTVGALDGKIVQWSLASRGALQQLIGPVEAEIEVLDSATGQIVVHVDRSVTRTLSPGRYEDAIRVSDIATGLATLQVGEIHVLATGFTAAAGGSPSGGSPSGGSPAGSTTIGEYISTTSNLVVMSQPSATVVLAQLDIPPGDWDVSATLVLQPPGQQSTVDLYLELSPNPAEWNPIPGYCQALTGLSIGSADYRTAIMAPARFQNLGPDPVPIYFNAQYTVSKNLDAKVFMSARRWD